MKLASILVLFGLVLRASAQDIAVVSVFSSGNVNEGGTGTFRIARSGSFSNSVRVFFNLSGTASNGLDYARITNMSVFIPAFSNSAVVRPATTNDMLVEGNETIVLTLTPSPLASPLPGYMIGTPGSATLTIVDNDTDPPPATNRPPVVRIVEPTNNATFTATTDITIFAEPRDEDGRVVTVEFFAGNLRLGSVAPNTLEMGPINPWRFTWSNAPVGIHHLRAKATDDLGAIGWSSNIVVTVRSPEEPRAFVSVFATGPNAAEGGNKGQFTIRRSGNTNVALTVYFRLQGSASNGVDYAALPGSVSLDAGVNVAELIVDPVDDALIEATESVGLALETPACIAIYPPPPECYVLGPSNTSALVWIADNDRSTNLPPPPPTNGVTIVTVTAIDAFAIEGPFTNRYGTNVWTTNRLEGTNWTTWRTNAWETNTATFRVSRNNTNGTMNVVCVLSGTASNGVDYVSLSGHVTIPAGQRSALVKVVPIDDALAEGIESVVLRVVPSPLAVMPGYMPGWPDRAGAIIIDNDVPRPPTTTLNDALFHLCAPATNGLVYRLEVSTNLATWTPVQTNVVSEGAVQFVDPEAPQSPQRFYRVVPTPVLPPE